MAVVSKRNEREQFNLDLCEALISANIPLSKLENPSFKLFLEKYLKTSVPCESTLRKNYVKDVYSITISKIREHIGNNFIYFVVDETTDSCGRSIANLLIGILNEEKSNKCYLITCKEIEKVNNVTITRFINEGLTNFFLPDAVPFEKVILML